MKYVLECWELLVVTTGHFRFRSFSLLIVHVIAVKVAITKLFVRLKLVVLYL